MPFTSLDDIVSEITNGKFRRIDWNKITGASALTAGRWYDFSQFGGTPVANAYAGTALAWTSCNELAGNGTQIFGMQHAGNVSPDTKHCMNVSAVSAVATAVPSVLMLADIQGYYPGISMNLATAQTLTGTPTLRYANGVGVLPFLSVTTATGATAHNVALSYTNQAAVAGRALAQTVACTASAIAAHITHTGTAANNFGPFLPLAGGDTGVQSAQSVTISAASGAGVAALVFARPLLTLPMTTIGVAAERDLLNQIPSLPRVYDGACLQWLMYAGAATPVTSAFYGHLDFGWG